MTRLAKASFAFTHGRSASAAGRSDGRALTTRGASREAKGSGAPSYAGAHAALLTFAIAAVALLAFAPFASAGKKVDSFIGSPTDATGTTGGLFNAARGVAVNQSGAGGVPAGTLYVVDGVGRRIQQFSAAGAFVRAWGRDVVLTGKPNDNGTGFEICDTTAGNVAADCKAGVNNLGGQGGSMNNPQGIAVNQSNGDLYVTESNFARVQQYTATGSFVRAFGGGVVDGGATGTGNLTNGSTSVTSLVTTSKAFLAGQTITGPGIPVGTILTAVSGTTLTLSQAATATTPGATLTVAPGTGNVPVNEQLTVAVGTNVGALTGGTFTLRLNPGTGFQTTTAIPFNASATQVQSALEGLAAIEPGDVSVASLNPGGGGGAGGPYTIEFQGRLSDTDVNFVGDAAGLTTSPFFGQGRITTTILVNGASGAEVCSAAAECRAGVTAGLGGAFGSGGSDLSYLTVAPASSPAAGDVYVADAGNRRVQQFTATGVFVRTWGKDVNATTPGEGPEVCTAASGDICKGGSPSPGSEQPIGTETGEFASNGPDRIAVDSTGKVYVRDQGTAVNGRVQTFSPTGTGASVFAGFTGFSGSESARSVVIGPSDRVLLPTSGVIKEYDAAGVLQDTHLVESGLTVENGLAINNATGNLYFSVNNRVFIADADGSLPVPAVTVDPVVGITESSATLTGTVNPNGPAGIPTSYNFEYSRNGTTWTAVPGATVLSPADGVGPQAVSANVSGLEANTFYRVRIQAKKAFGAATTTSGELTFLTDSVKPTVTTHPMQNVTDTSAAIGGSVNPNGKATTYRFQYGETTSYGSVAPVPDGNVTGAVEKYVGTAIEGLKPDTTYHFRLVASNEEGTTNGADQTFTTRAEPAELPERAYEQVSAVEKNGNDVLGWQTPVALDGNRATYTAQGAFANSDRGYKALGAPLWYQAGRTPGGWQTTLIGRRLPDGTAPGNASINALLGDAGGAAVFRIERAMEADSNPRGGLYTYNTVTDEYSSLARGLASSPLTIGEPEEQLALPSYQASSKDGSHIVIRSTEVLTDEPGIPASDTKFYEIADGEMRLVSRDTSNTPFPGAVSIGREDLNPISDDGNHIFFSTPTSGNGVQIYRRSDGTTTKLVSPSKRTPVDPSGAKAKEFLGATPDQGTGDPAMVFFASSEHLTNNANTGPTRSGKDLYRYDITSDTLVDISAETNTANGARFQGLLGHSDDGKWVYYVALGQVVPGKGVDGQPNVYLWHDDGSATGTTRFIATLAPTGCSGSGADGCNLSEAKVSRVTPDGQTLAFQSTRPLTGYANGGNGQVFVYEADERGGAGQLSCISCHADGSTPTGPSRLPSRSQPESLSQGEPPRSLTVAGGVFFESPDALLGADVNDQVDLYEWSEGQLGLISSGKEKTDGSNFSNATPDGGSVFFLTRGRLVGQDQDDLRDLYGARVGGGIAAQNEPPPGEPCAAEGCKSAAQTQSAPQVPASSTAPSTGNVVEPKPGNAKCRKGQVKRKGKCTKRKASKRKANKRANKSRRAGK